MASPPHDMASAALRHIRDARRLCAPPASLDQAWHLAGFGPECARKAALSDPRLRRLLGHDAEDAALLSWLLSLDPRAQRSVTTPAPTGGWSPQDRYERTGSRGRAVVEPLLEACEADTLELVSGLWCAGVWRGEGERA